jgi:hypothetical protein
VSRPFRIWEKKRGQRRTGSKLLGGLGEGLFFAALFFLGAVSVTALITSRITREAAESEATGIGFWLTMLVLVSSVLIGAGGFVLTMLQFGASAERRSNIAQRTPRIDLLADPALSQEKQYPSVPSDGNLTNSPGVRLSYRLPSEQSPFWRLALAMAFAVIWNVIAAVLVVLALGSFRHGRPEWFLAVVAAGFVLVGVWAIYYFVRQMAILTGIGPTGVEISAHPFIPGGKYDVFITQAGRLHMRILELVLVCEEEATYHQGTDVRTDRARVFAQQVFCQRNFDIRPGSPLEQECQIEIPPSAMHSFKSNCNAVQWKLVVRGHSRGWPRFERSFPVVVYPEGAGQVRA